MAKKRAAGDTSTLTGTHASEKIILAANALQHLPQTPQHQPTFYRLKQDPLSIPGCAKIEEYNNFGKHEMAILAACPILYGVIHFVAWGDQFPTTPEALLWRVCSFVVTFSGFIGVTVVWHIDKYHRHYLRFLPERIIDSCALIIPIFHMLASAFLIVESFRQLFFLDPAAYQLPSWSNYWPHFS